jgi:hypothetical protein
MNAHIACAREKLASHPTGKIWTMLKIRHSKKTSGPQGEGEKKLKFAI